MNKIFHIDSDSVRLTKDIKEIKVFKEIIEMENSDKLLSYIYHCCDVGSPYTRFVGERRKEEVKEDYFGEDEVPDIVEEGCKKYSKLAKTPALALLEAAREGANQLIDYFRDVDPSMSDKPGKEAKDLMSNLSKVGDIINKFDEWEDMIKKEQDKAQIRKGVKISKYNR